jgi:uncharacterized membrane protein (DUF485 family)
VSTREMFILGVTALMLVVYCALCLTAVFNPNLSPTSLVRVIGVLGVLLLLLRTGLLLWPRCVNWYRGRCVSRKFGP